MVRKVYPQSTTPGYRRGSSSTGINRGIGRGGRGGGSGRGGHGGDVIRSPNAGVIRLPPRRPADMNNQALNRRFTTTLKVRRDPNLPSHIPTPRFTHVITPIRGFARSRRGGRKIGGRGRRRLAILEGMKLKVSMNRITLRDALSPSLPLVPSAYSDPVEKTTDETPKDN